MTQGRRVLARINDKTFRRLFLGGLAIMGIVLIIHAL